MKLRTVSMLQDFLDQDFTWRLKEIASLKITVRQSLFPYERTLIRAGVPLLYAHWEGFIKNASIGYINFVQNQRLNYSKLTCPFIVLGLKRRLQDVIHSRKALRNISAVEFIMQNLDTRAKLSLSHAVDTESNLNSDVFENIAVSIGIDTRPYEPRFNLIDESLLRRRNGIAHGEYLDLDADEYRQLADDVLFLLRLYKNDIENAASMGRYKR